jgi:Ca-activated chloride channel family protein
VVAALAAPAAAQQVEAGPPPEQRSVLIVLDGSKSMNEPAGAGGTRLDAAKAALKELIPALPADAQVGLRVYGSEVAESSRAAGCRDTKLLVPVGPLASGPLRSRIDAIHGKGRTPIGRSLLAAPGDLPVGGKRTVVLVSDGGDNCAPPPPCQAARSVSKQGVDLSISVVGLQVNARVRRQLKCIAKAGGGAYVDAGDPAALRDELLAAIARAFRSYDATGTPVSGASTAELAPSLGEGQYLDHIRPGNSRFYAIRVAPGQRLFGSVTLPLPRTSSGTGGLNVKLLGPSGEQIVDDHGAVRFDSLGQYGNIKTVGLRTRQVAAPGIPSELQPGVYRIQVALEAGDLNAEPIPLELALQALDPNEEPGLVRTNGRAPAPPPSASPAPPKATATATATPAASGGGGSSGAGLIAGGGGLLAGLAAGFGAMRRRRS